MILRFIDEINGVGDIEPLVAEIKSEIRYIKRQEASVRNRRRVRALYEQLDELQFKPDYMCLVIDREKDYWRACKGFVINGIKYVRLLGTNGGIKNSTIVFVSERIAPELRRRIDNGRDKTKELVPAKLEAYQALVCSGSEPVSFPRGVAVVDDCMTKFLSDVITIRDDEPGEPVMEFVKGYEIELDESDGYGIMLPSLAQRWSEDLGLDYLVSGVNTRFCWEKGMVFTFDFLDFADKVAGRRVIKDAWGDDVDLTNVDLILTTSMVKLWDSYPSCEEYLRNRIENGYTFCVTKECPKSLEKERSLNYQFIQSYDLDDQQVEELISPTIDEIHDILRMDWRKSVLFLKGTHLNEDNVDRIDPDFAKAIMIDQRMMNDPFVRKKIYYLIKKRITDAKIGVIKVHGNFSIISGDPFALCQNMFGMEVTGLLRAGEVYNRYWLDAGADKVVCFRAPMTCHNNIRLMNVNQTSAAKYWYRYMNTCTLLNAWDTATHALNGADKDGDLVLLTDNKVLIENTRELPALMCMQRRAAKCIPSDEDMIRSNIMSFGDDIGKITNRITSMFDVQAGFEKGSPEYEMLEYRIRCGQNYQQNSIDKAKGIISEPMPKEWYDRSAVFSADATDEEIEFNANIVADKKPYFMRYIYPTMMKQYNTYINNTSKKALREFRVPLDELLAKDEDNLTEAEKTFLFYYRSRMPVGVNPCVMNRICRRFEEEFDGYLSKYKPTQKFDHNILKSGVEYTSSQRNAIEKIYSAYNARVQDYMLHAKKERVDDDDVANSRAVMVEEFRAECVKAWPRADVLCDILVDICYSKESSKQFLWDIAGEEVISNLIKNNGNTMTYPTLDDDGDIIFGGERFTFRVKEVGGCDYECDIE